MKGKLAATALRLGTQFLEDAFPVRQLLVEQYSSTSSSIAFFACMMMDRSLR
jgi:hypothetical protein